jgi:anti-sigma B factor antagonist
MTIKVTQRAGTTATVVQVDGELDMDSAPMLRAVLDDALDRGDVHLVLDAARLRFCDSVGLSVLLTTHFASEARGGYLRVACPTDQLLHLLSVVGLAQHVICFHSVEAAVGDDRQQAIVHVPHPLDAPPER